jgi:hypothetical protein
MAWLDITAVSLIVLAAAAWSAWKLWLAFLTDRQISRDAACAFCGHGCAAPARQPGRPQPAPAPPPLTVNAGRQRRPEGSPTSLAE